MNTVTYILPEGGSAWIREFSYEGKNLNVYFINGKGYSYHDVPENLFHEMVKAESKGKFLCENLKGKFEGHQLD